MGSTAKRGRTKQVDEWLNAFGVAAGIEKSVEDEYWWEPRAENVPQQKAYACKADRLFYGGAAGGGKSELLLGLCFTAHKDSIVFRREYPQLQALIKRSREIVNMRGRFNGTQKIWSDLPEQRTVEFGAVQREWDVEKYQGRPHDLIGFDEITHFTRSQFDFLTGWNRSAVPGQRCRIVATGNPPTTPEGFWVKEYWGPWIDSSHKLYPYPPGELLWFATIAGEDMLVDGPEPFEHEGENIIPHSRTFIPASLQDNPDLASTNYESVLQAMPEPLRSQMLFGSFDIEVQDDPWQVIPSKWVDAAIERWDKAKLAALPQTSLGVDVARGGTDETVITSRHGNIYAELVAYPGASTPDGPAVAAQVIKHLVYGAYTAIDVVGVGGSVYDALKGSVEAYAVSGGTKAVDIYDRPRLDSSKQLEFFNCRSWMIWRFRELLDPESGYEIALPDDSKLKADLCAPRWKVLPPIKGSNAKGRIQVESKEDIKKRIGRSPDRGDALIYASLDREDLREPTFETRSTRAYI